jgi:2-polyprenyl-6-methoxyphenol hydroxylase-like FAD-dependent oxidoreductase
MRTRPHRVAVVGFGIAGAATAYLLARTGHFVTLLERSPYVGPIGAGLLLQPVGQAVLGRMGLLDRVLAGAAPVEELHAVRHGGKDLIRLRYAEDKSGVHAYGVHRGALFTALADAVRSQPVEVRLGCEIVGLTTRDDQVILTDACGSQHGPFDFVIAADGSRSILRSLSGLRHWSMPYHHGALWVTGPCAAIHNKLYQVCRGTRQLLGILPIGGGRCSLYWGIRINELGAVRARGIDPLKRELVAFCPEVNELVEPVRTFDQLVFTTYRHVWMPRWYTRHVLVIGDAAHATSPHLGQGGGLALLDAWVLNECINQAPDHFSAFRLYARRRGAHLRFYNWLTFVLSPFFQGDGRLKGVARNLVLPLMPRVPWMRRQMRMTMCGWKRGWIGGRLPI